MMRILGTKSWFHSYRSDATIYTRNDTKEVGGRYRSQTVTLRVQ